MPKNRNFAAYCENKECGVGLTSLHATGLCKPCRTRVCAQEGCEKTFVLTRGANNALCAPHERQAKLKKEREQRLASL